MDRRPAIKPGPDLRQADTGRDDDSFDSATDGDGFSRLDTGVTGMTGSSIDTLYDLGLPAQALADESEDAELDEPVPNAERLVAQAVALAGDDHDAATLVDRFWRFAPDEELIGFTAEEMLEAARAHRDLAQQRVPGELKLRIHEPDAEQHHTVVEIVTDDMPFLVDSVTALLNSRHLDVHLLVHPLVVVRREPLGRLTEVSADVEPDDAIAGDLVESWMRIEIDPVRDPAERETLRRELQRVLTDVREAVEDCRRCGSGPSRSPTSWPPPGRRTTARRCRRRTSPTRWSCCAGWRTTTSRSSATGSTGWSTPTARAAGRPWRRCSAPGWASCAPTRRRPGR